MLFVDIGHGGVLVAHCKCSGGCGIYACNILLKNIGRINIFVVLFVVGLMS